MSYIDKFKSLWHKHWLGIFKLDTQEIQRHYWLKTPKRLDLRCWPTCSANYWMLYKIKGNVKHTLWKVVFTAQVCGQFWHKWKHLYLFTKCRLQHLSSNTFQVLRHKGSFRLRLTQHSLMGPYYMWWRLKTVLSSY